MALHIPSPAVNGFHLGSLFIHFYGLMYVVGIALAIWITRRRWQKAGGDPALVAEVATWAVPAGIIGGRGQLPLPPPPPIPPRLFGGFSGVATGVWGSGGPPRAGAAAGPLRGRPPGP